MEIRLRQEVADRRTRIICSDTSALALTISAAYLSCSALKFPARGQGHTGDDSFNQGRLNLGFHKSLLATL